MEINASTNWEWETIKLLRQLLEETAKTNQQLAILVSFNSSQIDLLRDIETLIANR